MTDCEECFYYKKCESLCGDALKYINGDCRDFYDGSTGCEYCKGRAYTKKPLTVITRYGRRIELAFDYCPKCGRRIKPFDEDLLKEREEK